MGRQALSSTAGSQRSIDLDGAKLAYELRRSSRRSVAVQVRGTDVRVAAPQRMPLGAIEAFLRQHADWLRERLALQATQVARTRLMVEDGVRLPVLGEPVRLRLDATPRTVRWSLGADGVDELRLPLARTEAALIKALRARALPWFRERVAEYCYRLGVAPPAVRLTSARTRWGSCSSASGIRLHWRLVHLEPTLIDYVVAHEVAHLREMNHSPRFWSVVEQLCPDWKRARQALRLAARDLPIIEAADGSAGEASDWTE